MVKIRRRAKGSCSRSIIRLSGVVRELNMMGILRIVAKITPTSSEVLGDVASSLDMCGLSTVS